MTRYTFVLLTAARQQWIYRTEMLMRAIQMVLFMGVFMALWTTAFGVSERPELAGYSLAEMVWYLAMTETITLSTSRVFLDISEAVKAGDLAYTLARPLSYPFYQVANSLGGSVPRFALNLLTAAAVVGLGVGSAGGSLPGLLAFLGMAALALLLDALIAVLIGLTAFWIEEVMPVYLIYQKLLFTVGGLFLPLEMFPDWLRRVGEWLPFQFIAYAPARAFVEFEPRFVLRAACGQVAYVVALGALVILVWRRAQRRMVVHGGEKVSEWTNGDGKTARLVWGYVRHNLMSAMAYRGAFFLQVFGMVLNDAMLLFFWWVLFSRLPTLQGWDLAGVMTLYGVVAFGFGVANVVCGNAFLVARVVVSGDLDYYLALPADPLVHLLVSRMSLSAWGDLLFGLAVFLVATPDWWGRLPLFLLLGAITGVIFVAFSVLVGSLAFWVGNADNLAAQAINALITFGLYPVEIFPGVIRVLLYTLIPAAFVGSLPAELLAEFDWGRMATLVAFTAGILLAARLVFQWGLRRYESGNLVTVRG